MLFSLTTRSIQAWDTLLGRPAALMTAHTARVSSLSMLNIDPTHTHTHTTVLIISRGVT